MADTFLLCALTILEVTKQNLLLCCYAMCTVFCLLIYSFMSSIVVCIFTPLHVVSMHVRRDTVVGFIRNSVFIGHQIADVSRGVDSFL